MPLMSWNDQLSVGVKAIDDDHKKLLGLTNELYDGITAGKGKEQLAPLLENLIVYTQFHFAREEQFFSRTSYSAAAQHTREHEELTTRVIEIRDRYMSGSPALTLEVMVFLKDWLFAHILGSDKKYGPYLNGMGIF